jgi:glucan biosynthesis protein C
MVSRRTEGAAPPKQKRLYYLDWLRVLAVLTVFIYHTLRPFDFTYWHVKNTEQSLVITILLFFFSQWGMVLFFVLSGAACWFALRSRSGRQFLRERSLRLLVPLVVGILLFSPLQAYLEALNHGTFAGTFLQFVPWFVANIQLSWHAPWINYPYHLWFLEFLWVFSLIALPLFLFLRGAAGSRVIDTLAAWCARPGGIFLIIVPIALIRVILGAAFPSENDWAAFVYYLAFFVYGYLLFSRPSFVQAIRRQGWIALSIGILCFTLIGAAYAAGYLETWASSSYTLGAVFYQLLLSIFTWAWLVFVLSCGIRWLNFNTKRLPEVNEAVLPFYVLQQPAIVVIAFFVVQWDLGILPKWLIISTLALALILAVYVLVIRRVNWIRWLFGMKPRPRTPRRDGNGREQEEHQAEALGGKADQAVPLHTWREASSETRSAQSDAGSLIVFGEMLLTNPSSTAFCASNRTVQWSCPSGAGLHATAVR